MADTPRTNFTGAPSLRDFVSTENENFEFGINHFSTEVEIFYSLDKIYKEALFDAPVPSLAYVIHPLLFLCHYQLLAGFVSVLRCHISESGAATRIGIDAALAASLLVKEPELSSSYLARRHPFDKLMRFYRNLVRDKPHTLEPHILHLITRYDYYSQYALHADASCFALRLRVIDIPKVTMVETYFEIPDNERDFKVEIIQLLRDFCVMADIFSNFLVSHKMVSKKWPDRLLEILRQLREIPLPPD